MVEVPEWSQYTRTTLGITFFCRLLAWVVWDSEGAVCLAAPITAARSALNSLVQARPAIPSPALLGTAMWSSLAELGRAAGHHNCTGATQQTGLGRLHIDTACLVLSNLSRGVRLVGRSEECWRCPLQQLWSPGQDSGIHNISVQTRYPSLLQLQTDEGNVTCGVQHHFEQYGLYQLDGACQISVLHRPVNAFLPIFWAFIALCCMAGLRLATQSVSSSAAFRRLVVWLQLRDRAGSPEPALLTDQAEVDAEQQAESAEIAAKQARRVRSLDAFRGLSITVMIFVNYGGGSYYFFNHSPWNGLTVADLVFPWFIWIMGVSLAISTQAQLRKSVARPRILVRVFRRSLILVILGLVLNTKGGSPTDLSQLRLPGVLQRFGLTYLAVAGLEAVLLPRQYPDPATRGPLKPLLDLTSSAWQWLAALLCLALHTSLTLQLPVPGCPTGYLGPGGLADNASHPDCTGGAARWIDVSVFGPHHIYQRPTSHAVYGGVSHDPEGLLGVLTSIFLCWLGVAAGKILLVHQDWRARVARWLVWAAVCGLLAGSLSSFSKNQGVLPINKNLWSVSFTLATASMAFLLLTGMFLLIDVNRFWSGSPLLYPGMNSILMYVGHEMCSGMFPWAWRPFTRSHAELLGMNMWGCGLWVFASYLLYKKRIFVAL